MRWTVLAVTLAVLGGGGAARAQEPSTEVEADAAAEPPEADAAAEPATRRSAVPPAPGSAEEQEGPWVPLFELSLGETQFFAPALLPGNLREVVPTSAALFLAEIFITYRWRVLAFANLPLSTEKVIVDGELVERYSPPALAAGLSFSPWWMDFRERRRIEIQIAAAGGIFLRREVRGFPMVATRLYFLHDQDLGLYIGFAWAFAPGTAGLMYGFGYRF